MTVCFGVYFSSFLFFLCPRRLRNFVHKTVLIIKYLPTHFYIMSILLDSVSLMKESSKLGRECGFFFFFDSLKFRLGNKAR